MSHGPSRFVMLLQGLPAAVSPPPSLLAHWVSKDEADAVLDSVSPEVVVVDPAQAWHRAIANRAQASGSAVVAVGARPAGALTVDDWVAGEATAEEFEARLGLACARARERRRLARRSCTDLLTGLPNRRALISAAVQLAAQAHRRGEPISLVLLDLDGFKQVNDTLGHPAGDRLLRRVGGVLKGEVRHHEVCGRMGGDEFAVVFCGGPDDAQRVRDRLIAGLKWEGVDATAGVATSTATSLRHLRQLYADADAALLIAKRQRGRFARRTRPSFLTKEVESNAQLSLT